MCVMISCGHRERVLLCMRKNMQLRWLLYQPFVFLLHIAGIIVVTPYSGNTISAT